MKILVTGASGYIGRHVVKKLLDMGQEVIACSRNLEAVDNRAIKVQADILSSPITDWFSCFYKPDVCIHLAWRDGFSHNSPAHMEDLSGHYRFLRSLLNSGIHKLAVMGTMHEVGYYEGAVHENTPCNPQSQYGVAKDALRKCIELSVRSESCIFQWLRAFYIYGDDFNNHSVFSKLLEAEKNGNTVFPFTSGKNLYDFIDVVELSGQIVACVLFEEEGGIINCCTGSPVCLSEMVEAFIKKHHLSIRLAYGAYPDRKYDSPGIWGDADRIKRILKRGFA